MANKIKPALTKEALIGTPLNDVDFVTAQRCVAYANYRDYGRTALFLGVAKATITRAWYTINDKQRAFCFQLAKDWRVPKPVLTPQEYEDCEHLPTYIRNGKIEDKQIRKLIDTARNKVFNEMFRRMKSFEKMADKDFIPFSKFVLGLSNPNGIEEAADQKTQDVFDKMRKSLALNFGAEEEENVAPPTEEAETMPLPKDEEEEDYSDLYV